MIIKKLLPLVIFITLTGCHKWAADDLEDDSPFKGQSAKVLYHTAEQAIAKKEYITAEKNLEALESLYPFSTFAEAAQLKLIFSYYENKEYASAAATAERFIHLYPRSHEVDYAYYMKGLSNFQQTRGYLAYVLPLDESWRDPGTQMQAYADLANFVERFPESRFRANAMQRLIYLRNMFAKRELNTAKYYFKRRMYVASIERVHYLIKSYPQSPAAKASYKILIKANLALGFKAAALDAKAVYEATYHLPAVKS